ncbi:hypothetical protein [Streptomyces sp. NPDC058466]|uniref:hypothetical protein n=1 Tax=Streptomyces sp. NPDC058466 TaxID=3346512 RepID=UPI003648E294
MGAPRLGEEKLIRVCHVTGFFESVQRNGVFSRRWNLLAPADEHTTLGHLAAAVPRYVLDCPTSSHPSAPAHRSPQLRALLREHLRDGHRHGDDARG